LLLAPVVTPTQNSGRHGAMRMIPRVTRGVRITSNEWMKQALLDGIDQSQ